ncbi:MAG: SDR family oxidoreductase [Shewanella algae]
MTKVLILGANGQIARWVVQMLADRKDIDQTLLVRDPNKLSSQEPKNAQIVIGDVLDSHFLQHIMVGQDVVYANLAGDVDVQAEHIVTAMAATGVKRLIFVNSLGIYDEVPGKFGEWNNAEIGSYLNPYRRAADIIEAANVDHTILRAAWLTDKDEVNYETTERHEPFKGTEVSRKSVAELIVEIISSPALYSKANIGVNKPNTAGDKPAFA